MAEFPALPLWTDAYLGDTTHLTTFQHGAYLLLLMTAWRTRDCALPDDDDVLARFSRCTRGQWKSLRPILAQFFIIKNGKWRQLRLVDEHVSVRARREKAAANGRASALKRKGRHSTEREQSDSEASAKEEQSENLTISISSTVSKEDTGADGALNDPESSDFNPVKALFDDGVRLLGKSGIAEKSARSLIGRWRREYDDDSVALAIATAEARNISSPIEWIPKALASRQSRSPGQSGHKSDDLVEIILAENARKPAS